MIDSYNKLPLYKFQQITELKTEGKTDIEVNEEVLSILADMSVEDLEELPINIFRDMMNRSAFLKNVPTRPNAAKVYKLSRYELVPTLDVRKLTAGQYIDFQTMMQQPEDQRTLDAVLSIVLIPKGMKYSDQKDKYDIEDVRACIREELDTASALGLRAFFLASFALSIRAMRSCLDYAMSRKKITAQLTELRTHLMTAETMLKDLAQSGVGLPW